ncbi:MAG: hypothetical protein K6B67_05765 [Lachnospiraceae bacterium]|nr:hypothetical protein [Lachnospiraceae bacterium]
MNTREEMKDKLKHLITCMKCKVSGKCCDENCPTQYDVGNMGEIIENLEEISKILEQKPCEDAISRSSLLGKLDDYYKEKIKVAPDNMAEGFVQVEKLIKQELSVTPTQEWTPVSEGLPKKTGWYLITFKVYGGGYAVCEMSYRKPENYWTDKNISKKVLDNDEVVAWMPKPKPYKADKESDDNEVYSSD